MEILESKVRSRRVDYENYRSLTHVILGLIIATSISLHVALWPHYGGLKTVLIGIMIGWGVLLQSMLLFTTVVQNFVGIVLMTLFLQEYGTA
mmetsp:Transcript_26835/g.61785  ORF Transcript_26835/g.61785 Transcript_26835/m.61785 type:complete len:92 (+) Transcript_26835:540-815(+)